MYQGSLSDYRVEVNADLKRIKDIAPDLANERIIGTVNKILDWIEDKAGQEVGLHEVAAGIGDQTRGVETFFDMGRLIGGKAMMKPFFKVQGPDGSLYLLDDVFKASEGETYVTPGTGELLASSKEDLKGISYTYFKIANFTHDSKPSI